MPLWDKHTTPKYVIEDTQPEIYFDESGYWLIYVIFLTEFTRRLKEELIVTINEIDSTSMGILGVPLRMQLSDDWIAGYGLLTTESGLQYFATEDGFPIAIEI